jgi:uncharacterized protein YdeI (YjbR/CyaY-like superfamily)
MEVTAKIYKIGINPFIFLPRPVLKKIFTDAGKDKGQIPISVEIDKTRFLQTLVKYSGKWRLYLNTPMRKAAGRDVGDKISVSVNYDPAERITVMDPKLKIALKKNKTAGSVFDKLSPSRKKEIMRYINNLKTEVSRKRNIDRTIMLLMQNRQPFRKE